MRTFLPYGVHPDVVREKQRAQLPKLQSVLRAKQGVRDVCVRWVLGDVCV